MARAVIAFGSNIGEKVGNCQSALLSVRELGSVLAVSSFYESAPMYLTDQSSFVNGVLMLETDLEPAILLSELKEIEKRLGREEGVRNGPRVIDLDIIWHEEYPSQAENPTLPHPGAWERRFVLEPLNEIAPDLVLIGYGTVKNLFEREYIQKQEVWRIPDETVQLPGS